MLQSDSVIPKARVEQLNHSEVPLKGIPLTHADMGHSVDGILSTQHGMGQSAEVSATSPSLPAMFYLQPIDDFHTLPLGSEFDVVYCPEITTGDGWRLIHFKTIDVFRAQKKDWVRAVEQRSKTPISELEAQRLWERLP